jgi:hypothetical protein
MKKIFLILIIALAFFALSLTGCDNDGNGKDDPEQPEYRTATVTFAFKGGEGEPLGGTYKAEVQGTMLLADWNNAKTAVKTKIETAEHNASNRSERIDFINVFGENDTTIIFTANVSNGKLEVKDGEWNKLYVNPTALDSITEAEIKTAVATMRNGIASPPLELENKTFPITLKDGALVFTVAYKALPADAEPAYLAYLQTRLEAISTNAVFEDEVNHLISVGNSYTITVEYANPVYEGIKWNATTRTFAIHNDWIATATGTDLSAGMMAEAFRSVEAE